MNQTMQSMTTYNTMNRRGRRGGEEDVEGMAAARPPHCSFISFISPSFDIGNGDGMI